LGLVGLAFAIAMIGGIGLLSLRSGAPQAGTSINTPATITVERGDVQKTVTAPGQLVGTHEIVLIAAVSGQVVDVAVRPGDAVAAGERLMQLDRRPFQQALDAARRDFERATHDHSRQLAEAELALQSAEVRLAQARARYPGLTAAEVHLRQAQDAAQSAQDELNKALDRPWESEQVLNAYRQASQFAQDALAVAQAEHDTARRSQTASAQELKILETEIERAKIALEGLKAGIDPALKANIDRAQHDLNATSLTAPFAGVILEVHTRLGESVPAGQALFVLADPHAVEVRATLVEEDVPLVQPGQAASLFFDALPEAEVTGRVARIVPQRAPGDRPLFPLYLSIDGVPEGVALGMTVDASIIIDSRENVLRLPRALIKTRSDGTAQVEVWLGDRSETRTIKVGLRGDVFVEILEGLREGEAVIGES
jgi:RND family efflux transporter MFP subunit